MSSEDERSDGRFQYYLLEDNTIARWWLGEDNNRDEYMEIEILDKTGRWVPGPGWRIMGECRELDHEEAMLCIQKLLDSS